MSPFPWTILIASSAFSMAPHLTLNFHCYSQIRDLSDSFSPKISALWNTFDLELEFPCSFTFIHYWSVYGGEGGQMALLSHRQ